MGIDEPGARNFLEFRHYRTHNYWEKKVLKMLSTDANA